MHVCIQNQESNIPVYRNMPWAAQKNDLKNSLPDLPANSH